MQTINLKQYYPFCKEDIFVEVSDEIVEAFLLDKRAEAARDRKMFRYKAFYSLDCNDGIENAAIGWAHTAGWKITHWNTANRRKIFCWNEKK